MNNKNKKIISFDLDGTLADSKQEITISMAKFLCDLAKYKYVAIISGGSYEQFEKQFLPNFKPDGNNTEIIYKNLILLPTSGSKRYQYEDNKWIMTDIEEMKEEVRGRVLTVLNNYIESGKYGIGATIEGDTVIEDRLTQITISALGQKALLSDKSKWDPDQLKRKEIKKELEGLLPEVEISIGGMTSIDILPKGFNKAKGLLRLLEKLNLEKKDMLFVGDSIFPGGNDYSPYEAGVECLKTKGPEETIEIIKGLF